MAEIEKMDLESANLVDERLEQMRELFPEVFSESGIDFEKLRLELGDAVDDGGERFAFTWPGKHAAIRQAQTSTDSTLRPCPGKSTNWDTTQNLYIEGDNLEVLKLLQRGYHGMVDIIYIDPPYNTGGDFVYKDSFVEPIGNYLAQINAENESNVDTSGRLHSKWCSMIYPRIKLGRELLADTGVMFISIGDSEVSTLIKISDEIFGETNRIGIISRQMKTGNNQGDFFAPNIDYILAYAKDASQCNPFMDTLSEELVRKVYNKVQQGGLRDGQRYRTMGLYQASLKHGGSRYPINCPDGSQAITPEGMPWRWNEERLRRGIQEDDVLFVKTETSPLINPATGKRSPWNIYTKIWLEDRMDAGQLPKNVITGMENRHGAKEVAALGIPFDFPKPSSLIKHLVKIFNKSDALVVDFFSGSGTTFDAVMQQNSEDSGARRVILIQLPEACGPDSAAAKEGYASLCDVGEERIRRAGAKIVSEVDGVNRQLKLGEEPKRLPDIGFRVFRLDDSGIEKPKPGELMLDVVKPDRSDLDIVFEMMLKWGLELTLPVDQSEMAGYPCYSVAYGELVCCLAPGLTVDALEAIAEMEPRRVLMLDRILDDSLKLNAVQIFKRVEERTGREVELRTV